MINVVMTILFVIDILCAFLLIGIILIQQSKSGGGLGAIAGGMGESVFGAAAGNVITKTTVILASIFMVTTLLLAVLSGRREKEVSLGAQIQQEAESERQLLTNETPAVIDEAVEEPAAPAE